MEKVRLADLFEKPISGEWGTEPGEHDKNVFGVIRTTNFRNDGRLDTHNEIVLRKIDETKFEKKKLKYGDIVIEKSGGSPTQPVGRVVYYDIEGKNYLCNNFTSILRPKDHLHSKYVFYLMHFLYKIRRVDTFQDKTIGIINLKLDKYLKSTEVSIPTIEIQKRVVEALDKAQLLIDLRKRQIELVGQLGQSVFIDMFGDPVLNPKGWKKGKLDNFVRITGGYAFESKSFKESGIPIIKIGNVNKGYFDISPLSFWERDYESKLEKYVIYPGDLLITLTGTVGKDDYGNVCIADGSYPKYMLNQRVAKLEINNDLNRDFIKYCFSQKKFKYNLVKLSRGVRQANISNKDIYGLDIIVPDLELQNKFSLIVQKNEKQRKLLQNSLDQLENNFNSIMEKTFKGELFT